MSDEETPARRLVRQVLKEAPWMLGIWAMAVLALIVFGALTGDTSPREALTVGLGFLPLAIPLAPFTWLHFDPRPRQARQAGGDGEGEAEGSGESGEAGVARSFPNVGFGCLWAILTMPLAVGLGLFLTRLVGGE